jgi:hypothetical protein
MKNQTAVEWLFAEYINPKNQTSMASLFLEALQMEKVQIMNSYEQGIKDDDGYGGYISNSENYYNETFGQK